MKLSIYSISTLIFLGLIEFTEISAQQLPDLYQLITTSIRTGNTEIFMVDPVWGDAVNLTNSTAEERYPAVSPDGKTIAFTSNRDGTFDLYVINIGGTGLKQLTFESEPAVCYMPCWSGDGKKIVFGLHAEKAEMAAIHPDGTGFRILGEGHDPCISPDGKTIAFTWKGKNDIGYCVWLQNYDGTNRHQLTPHESIFGAVFPVWSPNGKQLLYTGQVGESLEIFKCNADGSGITQITHLNRITTPAAWSPDGNFISVRVTESVFWSEAETREKTYSEKKADLRPVWIMNADGSQPRVVEPLKFQCAVDGSRAVWRLK